MEIARNFFLSVGLVREMDDNQFFEATVIDEDILAVVLRGNLDSTTTDEFKSEVQKHLDRGMNKIIIDCRYMGLISSVGVGALITLQTRLRRRDGVVKLSSLQGMAANVIKLVRLDKLLDIYGDLEFARQSFYE